MSIRSKKEIKVYNEMPSQINLVGQHRTYIFPAAVDGVPSMNMVDFADIEYANSRGIVFAAGLLVFDEDEREEIYNELKMFNWQNTVWHEKDIVDAIENPTVEAMQKVIAITNLITIERFRGKVVHAINKNADISNKVVSIVNTRHKEISSGQIKSKLVIKPMDIQPKEDPDKKIRELEAQLLEMKKLMEAMAESKSEPVEVKEETVAAEPKKSQRSENSRKNSSAKK